MPVDSATSHVTVDERERDLFETAVEQFHIAADVMGLEDSMRRILSHCQRELIVSFPVEMDDGRLETFIGYPNVHSFRVGCSCGWTGMKYRERKDAFAAHARHAMRLA